MNTVLKASFAFVCVAIVVAFSATVANAEVLCNFEGGTLDYSNAIPPPSYPQTTGKFRDAWYGQYINLTNNGEGNDYLIMGRNSGGTDYTTTIYDLTPSDSKPSVFKTPVGSTTTYTADIQFETQSVASLGGIHIYDPLATGTSTKKGFIIEYIDNAEGSDDLIRIRYIKTESLYDSNIGTNYAVGQHNAPIVRLSMSLTNNGTNATMKYRVDLLNALEGNVTSTDPLWSSDSMITPNYGSATADLLNMAPAINGFEIGLHRNVSSAGNSSNPNFQVYFDNVTLSTVPEPGTLALLAAGLVGLLAYAWRKRR